MKENALKLFNIVLGKYDPLCRCDVDTLNDIENFLNKEFGDLYTAEDMANSLNEYCERGIEMTIPEIKQKQSSQGIDNEYVEGKRALTKAWIKLSEKP